MRKQVFTALLILAAWAGLVQGQPQPVASAFSVPTAAVGQRVELLPVSSADPATPTALPPTGLSCPEVPAAEPRSAGGQFWLRGEYLLWWTKGSHLPPLVTSGVPGTTPLPGGIGQTGTTVLFGNSDVDSGPRSGGRFTAGFWCDPCRKFGFDGSYFFLGSQNTNFNVASDGRLGSSFIARPFFDLLSGSQNAQLVAFPALGGGTNLLTATGLGLASGDLHASTYSRLQGGDINALCGLCSGCNYWVQMLGGFRYLQLNEGIAITENTHVNPALPRGSPFFGGSTISITDRFDTRNNFYGGQIGLRGEVHSGRLFVEAQCKVALGVTHQTLDIQGSTSITPPGGPTTVTPFGFLASGTGRYAQDKFSVVPEVGVNGGYLVTNHFRVFVGYNFLYWSSVVRPADQINLGLNGTQIPTDTRFNPAARPAVVMNTTGFWAQGISFGAEYRY